MPHKKGETYNNLIDHCIELEEDPEISGNPQLLFKRLLVDYFFKEDASESKGLEIFFNELEAPVFLADLNSILQVDLEQLSAFVEGEMVNDSLAGTIMLSEQYLKAFYSNHPPSYGKLPDDVKTELIGKIRDKNRTIISAFDKMIADEEADDKRKVISLVALIIKNIHLRTGSPINKLSRPAEDIFNDIFDNAHEIFAAKQTQVADLMDDTKIKEIIKTFFVIRQFKDITEMADMYKEELGRYKKRALKSSAS